MVQRIEQARRLILRRVGQACVPVGEHGSKCVARVFQFRDLPIDSVENLRGRGPHLAARGITGITLLEEGLQLGQRETGADGAANQPYALDGRRRKQTVAAIGPRERCQQPEAVVMPNRIRTRRCSFGDFADA